MIHHGDCLDVMAGMEPESVDAIVTDPLEERVSEIDAKYHGDACSVLFFDGDDECNCGLIGAIQDALGGLLIAGRHAHGPGVSLACPSCVRAEAEYDAMRAAALRATDPETGGASE